MAEPNPKWQAGVKERYDAFAMAYVLNANNGALAAREAGYSKNRDFQTANRLVRISYIKDKIAEIRAELAQKADISIDSVVDMVIDTYKRAKLSKNHSAELKAEDMLLRYLGAYEADNAQKRPDIRTFNLLEIKQLIADNEAIDAEISGINVGLAE